MRRALLVLAWVCFTLDAAAFLFFGVWALSAGTREGEQAYAIAFLLFAGTFLAVGGGALLWTRRRASALGLGCATLLLGVPPLIALGLWIGNLRGG